MHVWGSPGDLDAFAQRLDRMAAQLVDTGYALRRHAAEALWTGVGAEAFRSRIEGRVRQVEQVARSLGHAAHEVRAHADAIRREEAFVSAAWNGAVHVAGAVADGAVDFGGDVLDFGGDVLDGGGKVVSFVGGLFS